MDETKKAWLGIALGLLLLSAAALLGGGSPRDCGDDGPVQHAE